MNTAIDLEDEQEEPFIGPKERPIASWNIELMVDCPWCGHTFDLVDQWREHDDPPDIKPLDTEDLVDCKCPKCNEEFECETSC